MHGSNRLWYIWYRGTIKINPRSTTVVLLFVRDSFQTSCVCSICVIVPVCSCVSVDARVQMLWCMCQHFIRELIITLLHVCDSRITISSCCIVFALWVCVCVTWRKTEVGSKLVLSTLAGVHVCLLTNFIKQMTHRFPPPPFFGRGSCLSLFIYLFLKRCFFPTVFCIEQSKKTIQAITLVLYSFILALFFKLSYYRVTVPALRLMMSWTLSVLLKILTVFTAQILAWRSISGSWLFGGKIIQTKKSYINN